MNIVQQINCKKDFAELVKHAKLPVKEYPEYGKRVYKIYENVWKRRRNIT